MRKYAARKAYKRLHASVLILQTGLRTMAARNQFRLRKRTKAAVMIQVIVEYYMIEMIHLLSIYDIHK